MYVNIFRFGILFTCSSKNGLASNVDNVAITCDEIMESQDKETNFNEKLQSVKQKAGFTCLLSITILLLIAAIIFCYLIKHPGKQKRK